MIQQQTLLKVADNSGAKIVKCIKVLGGFKKTQAKIGDIVVVSIQKLRDNPKKITRLKKKDIFKAVVIRTTRGLNKNNGFFLSFEANFVALLDKQENPLGTRLNGFLPKKIKKKFNKLVSLSYYVI
jgi:large subunit ribosomal protein L14